MGGEAMINKIDLMNPSGLILVGRTGENAFRTITFDASTWGADFPDATYTVVYKRSDGYIYPVLVNAAADAIVWSPTDTDTAVSGNGQIEVRLLDGETIGKTIVMQTFVAPSLSGDESEPSTPAPDWVNDVAADADRAEEAVSHYPKIVNGYWWKWDAELGDWKNTHEPSKGEKGDTGDSFVDATYDSNTGTLTLIPGIPNVRGYVMPEWYGAKGDGITDDTVAVRRAMQEPFVLLRGTYMVTEPITCMASVVQGVGVDGGDIVCSGGNCLTFANSVRLSDFGIELPYEDTGIAITAQSDIIAEWISIDGGRMGIYSTGSYKRNVVRNSTFRNLWGDSAAAMHIDFAGITEFANNYIENVSNDLDRDADGIRIWQSKNVPHTVVRVVGNEMHNCRGRFVKCSTMQCEVSDNYLHNDDEFGSITSFNAIDVQDGNSLIRNNLIVAPSGINLSVRAGDKQHHVVVDNELHRIVRESGNNRAIGVTDYTEESGTTIDCTISRNQIYWGNLASIRLAYIANSTYRVRDNNAYDRTYDVVIISGTEDLSCRFEMTGNNVDGYAYFCRFSGSMPNVKGDRKVYCSTPLNFSGVLSNTSFVANTSNVEGFVSTSFMETLGTTSSYSIMLSDNNEIGAFKKNGQKIYYHAQGDPVLPKVTSADNGKTLKVVNGTYTLVSE